jgi:hypothetical protein
MNYFSEKINGPTARNSETISPALWAGLVSYINSLIDSAHFSESFPNNCLDSSIPVATDRNAFGARLKMEIPGMDWPLKTEETGEYPYFESTPFIPDTIMILDLIQFCYQHVTHPEQGEYHKFFNHYHLRFDQEKGKEQFREEINRIFARNGMIYELRENGDIERLVDTQIINDSDQPYTSDSLVNSLLNEALKKFKNPDIAIRKEGLEKCYDAFERMKTIKNPGNKADSTKQMLDAAASEANFRQVLEEEARALTKIGNDFHIRHFETNRTEISESRHIDYLYYRLWALLRLITKGI